MTDEEPTVSVPVSLIEQAADLIESDRGGIGTARNLRALLPKPTSRRLRVVDLDSMFAWIIKWNDDKELAREMVEDMSDDRRLFPAPDVMAIVEQTVDAWSDGLLGGRDIARTKALEARIRSAIEEAVGRG